MVWPPPSLTCSMVHGLFLHYHSVFVSLSAMSRTEPPCSPTDNIAVVLIGDSDIRQWPVSLYPQASFHHCSAVSGATLSECVPLVSHAVQQGLSFTAAQHVFVVACAGENDLAQSSSTPMTLPESCVAMDQFLFQVFHASPNQRDRLHVIFLGPKLEPWLDNDEEESRRDYIRLSRALEKSCLEHALAATHISFVDCLLMFCGASAQRKGALWGGQAQAESQYFKPDLLHLNDQGYKIWKDVIDDRIQAILKQQGE